MQIHNPLVIIALSPCHAPTILNINEEPFHALQRALPSFALPGHNGPSNIQLLLQKVR